MSWYWYLIIIVLSFAAMEFIAWATHKFLMHGFLWNLHEDHHVKTPGFFEKNDAFFLIFAIPSWLFIMLGSMYGHPVFVAIGYGIALYGIAYFLVHEVFIHQRFKWLKNSKNLYLSALRRAHKMHHKHLGKYEGESFGMLIIHPRYLSQEIKSRKAKQK